MRLRLDARVVAEPAAGNNPARPSHSVSEAATKPTLIGFGAVFYLS